MLCFALLCGLCVWCVWNIRCSSYSLGEFSELASKADRAHVNVKNGWKKNRRTEELNKQQQENSMDYVCAALRFRHQCGKKSGSKIT